MFAIGVDNSIRVHNRRVDAPLEPDVQPLISGGVGNTSNGAVRIAGASLRVCILEFPLNVQVGAELRDKKRAIVAGWTECIRVAIGTELRTAAILVVLDDNGISSIVLINGRRGVPAKAIRAQELAGGAELHQVAAGEIITGVRTIQNAAIGRNSDGR